MSAFMIKASDAKNFVFFSPLSKGGCGKPVKINASLLPKFLSLVDPKTHDGLAIIQHIQGLAAKAGHGGSLQNMNNAFEHMNTIKHVQIIYKIVQLDANSPMGVYVTDIRHRDPGDVKKPGLYSISTTMGASSINGLKLSATKVAINGQVGSLNDASKRALAITGSASVALLYNPSFVINELGVWGSTSKRANQALLATDTLAKVLTANQNRDNTLEWYVEGEGTALLHNALAKVSGELGKFKFQFIDPVGDTTSTLNLLKAKKAQLATDVVQFTGKRSSMVSLLTQRNKLSTAIRSLVSPGHPLHQDREKNVAKMMNGTSSKSAQYKSAVNTVNGGQATFIDALRQVQG